MEVTHIDCAVKEDWEPCYPRAIRDELGNPRAHDGFTYKNCIIHWKLVS